jgi:hypothetical protein
MDSIRNIVLVGIERITTLVHFCGQQASPRSGLLAIVPVSCQLDGGSVANDRPKTKAAAGTGAARAITREEH